ncbi:hypothetical protein BU23DRAFT_648328 [Bimuria novae-zelandiae CBS 107.79]|uniref:t-SNARE coiled-coil homology domain-containing protein n=1 Tax=Bimuria novae-zelandiae CBS 107.79 TaxID=1447943 RepID=A0A6A5V257_9PLEO|nr:hypothetical protein BU23DRAFT_648328 [Bimuria novae-zelandiae CBS 107.79]
MSSIKNWRFLKKKGASKTWSPSRTKTTEEQDQRPGLRSLPYECKTAGLVNPYELHSKPANTGTSTTAMSSGQGAEDCISPLYTSPMLKWPPLKPKGIKKKNSFIFSSKKSKTEPVSPCFDPPTALRLREEIDNIHASPPSTASSCSSRAVTFASIATCSSSNESSGATSTPVTDTASTFSLRADVEEDDITATKQHIRAFKLADISSTQNALRFSYEARDTGAVTLSRRNEQDERIARAELNLHSARVQNRIAGERLRALKSSNNLMHFSNPFFASTRERDIDDALVRAHQRERAERAAVRRRAWEAALRRRITVQVEVEREGGGRDLVERAKYQFEPDSEDDEFEDEIERNLEELVRVVPELKVLAVRMGETITQGNERLDGVRGRVEGVEDGMVRNRRALGRIH